MTAPIMTLSLCLNLAPETRAKLDDTTMLEMMRALVNGEPVVITIRPDRQVEVHRSTPAPPSVDQAWVSAEPRRQGA